MKSFTFVFSASVFATSILLGVLAGCSSESQPKTVARATATSDDAPAEPIVRSAAQDGEKKSTAEEHGHKPGSQGGIIVPIGSDSYHAEVVMETTGEFRLLMLGKDETRIQEVDLQPVRAYIRVIGDPDATPVELTAVPQDGDAPGRTSQFVGQLPEALRGRQLDVTIPNLQIAGERFRVGFTTVTEPHAEGMPASLPAEDERNLYLTAGGKYTEADIRANGTLTASQKFKGVMAKHDAKPVPGDRLCPISMTKANPRFTWIIGGRPYQFCCPPCVDEFVKTAKERPEEIQDPDTYIKAEAVQP